MAARDSSSQSSDDLDLDSFQADMLSSVTFNDLDQQWGRGQDILVTYRLVKGFKPSSRDWVGLYKADWKTPQQYLCFQWAPKHPRDYKFPGNRSVLFLAADIQVSSEPQDQLYQFLYITKTDDIVGMSKKFPIAEKCCEKVSSDDEISFVCLERPLGGVESLTVLESEASKERGLLESFEVVKPSEESTLKTTKVTADSRKDVKRSSDHETLLKDFDSTSKIQEKEFGSPLMLDFTSSIVKEYMANKDRSLVAVTERSLMPYDNSYLPIYSLASSNQKSAHDQVQELLTPLSTRALKTSSDPCAADRESVKTPTAHHSTPPSPTATAVPRPSLGLLFSGCKLSCSECGKRLKELRQVKQRCATFRSEIDSLRHDLENAEDTLTMKSILLDELSKQVKNLVHENTELVSTNERLSISKSDLRGLGSENRRLLRKNSNAVSRIEELRKENTVLRSQNDLLNQVARMSETDNDSLRGRTQYLENELREMRTQHVELEKLLDNIMYTLSLQGYTKMVDTNGNAIDLTKKKGSVLELDGWTVALSRKTERQLSTISNLQKMVAMVTAERDELKQKQSGADQRLEILETSIEAEKERSTYLQEKLDTLAKKLTSLLDERESLTTLVTSQQKEKQQLEQQSKTRQSDLSTRMQSLRDVVLAGRTIHNQKHLCESCSPKTSSTSVNVAKAKTPVTRHNHADGYTPLFTSPCTPGSAHQGARPKSTKDIQGKALKVVETAMTKAAADSLVTSAVKKATGIVTMETTPLQPPETVSKKYPNDMQQCFRKSLKSHSAMRRSRCDTPYPTSHDAVQVQPSSQDSLRAPASLKTSDESVESAENPSTFSLTEICQRALTSAATSLESMYDACLKGEIKKTHIAEKKSACRKLSLDKAGRKIKKPRKFHFKVFNPSHVQLPAEYTPRIYGSRPRKPPLVETPRSACPKCHRTFPPGFGQERINRHMDAHDKLGH